MVYPDTPLQELLVSHSQLSGSNLCFFLIRTCHPSQAKKTITSLAPIVFLFCPNYVLTVTPLFATQTEVLNIIILIGMLPVIYSLTIAFLTDHRDTEHFVKLHRSVLYPPLCISFSNNSRRPKTASLSPLRHRHSIQSDVAHERCFSSAIRDRRE